jgi:hypothetical protein
MPPSAGASKGSKYKGGYDMRQKKRGMQPTKEIVASESKTANLFPGTPGISSTNVALV